MHDTMVHGRRPVVKSHRQCRRLNFGFRPIAGIHFSNEEWELRMHCLITA